MKYHLKLGFDIDGVVDEPPVEGEKTFDSLADATRRMLEFIAKFGHPDAGPQTINICLRSEP